MSITEAVEALNAYTDKYRNTFDQEDAIFGLVEDLNDQLAAAQPDELVPPHLAEGQTLHLICAPDRLAAIRVFRHGGQEEMFEIHLHVNGDYPSCDVIKKTRGDMYVRAMVNGDYKLDVEVPGNRHVSIVVAQD